MDILISPAPLSGIIPAPPSKSYAHRYLIAAYLSGEKTVIKNAGMSTDVLATVGALTALGGNFSISGNDVYFEGRTLPAGEVAVDCSESGSTLRFLLPVAAAFGIKARFSGKDGLMKRPVSGLIEALNDNGAQIDGLKVDGRLASGKYRIDASVSSQYITGLMFALSVLDGDSTIEFDAPPVSADYIAITEGVISKFGVTVERRELGYYIRGGQNYRSPKALTVEGDWSGAAFFLAAGAIGGDVTVTGLNARDAQGDGRIADILARFGAKVTETTGGTRAERGLLAATDVDIDPIPDLAQITAVVAAYSKGVSVLRNVGRLRSKESDRVSAIIRTLAVAGVRAETDGNDLLIFGDNDPIGGLFYGGDDHRTAMSAAILATYARGGSRISGVDSHAKSYPDFLLHFIALGGKTNVGI